MTLGRASSAPFLSARRPMTLPPAEGDLRPA